MPTDFFFDTCFLRDWFRKNIELHNRNLLCPILFWSTTVQSIAKKNEYIIKNQEHWFFPIFNTCKSVLSDFKLVMSDTRNVIMSDARNEKFWPFAGLGNNKFDNKKDELNYWKFYVLDFFAIDCKSINDRFLIKTVVRWKVIRI
jgi:UDP-N-acetylglucosamine pyrophosphorylase